MMSGEGLLPCLGRHSLRPENGAESPRQVQSRYDLVCDQRLAAARPESQGPAIWIGYGGCASTLASASPLLSSRGSP